MHQNRALMWIASYFLLIPFAWRGFALGDHSPFTSDIRHYHHPITRAVLRALGEGQLPLWSPQPFLGFPLFADPQTAVFYPGTVLPAGLGPHWGYIVFLIAHSLLAAIGMFALMRSHGVENLGAWCAGSLVALSGYFAHEAQHPGLFAILCWIPAWLWTTHRFVRQPTPLRSVYAAAVVAMMIFAGTLQVLFGAAILYAFYVLGLMAELREQAGVGLAVRRVAQVVLAQLLGLSLAAVVLVPAVEHLPTTARALGMTYEFASMGSVHFVEWLGMFVNGSARWLGAGLSLDHEGASFYLGSLTLALSMVGLFGKRNALAISLGFAVVLLTVVAMGRYGGLHAWLFAQSPGLVGGLRGMGRALGPASVALAFLAGLGVQHLSRAERRSDRIFCVALIAVVLVHAVAIATHDSTPGDSMWSGAVASIALAAWFSLRWFVKQSIQPERQSWMQSALVGLVVIDLVAFGALDPVVRANPAAPAANELPDVIPELDALADGASGSPGERIMLHGFGPLNLPLLQGFDGVGGYNPLVSLQYLDYVNLINNGKLYPRAPIDQFVSGSKPQRFDSPLFDAASVRFIVSSRPERAGVLRWVQRYSDSQLGSFGASLFENDDAMPRAYLAFRTHRALDPKDLEASLARGFDPRRTTVVEGEAPELNGTPTIVPVVRVRSRPEHLAFEVELGVDVESKQPAVLVVTDAWHSGWRAWVDGIESPVFRANAMFRGVALAPGARHVEMRFEPRSFRVGATVSLLALGAGSVLVLFHVRGAFAKRRSRS